MVKKRCILWLAWLSLLGVTTTVGCSHTSYLESTHLSESTETRAEDASDKEAAAAEVTAESEEAATIYVQVAGAVRDPGVYELAEDARVYQAIDEAGGLTEEADGTDLFLAAKLADGQRLYVYTVEERKALLEELQDEASLAALPGDASQGGRSVQDPPAEQATADDGRVNINTADAATLTTLSGIGAAKAAAIIRYREENGAFAKPEDLMLVDGIGEGTYRNIEEQIRI